MQAFFSGRLIFFPKDVFRAFFKELWYNKQKPASRWGGSSQGRSITMYCEFCGKPVSDYAKYCRHCGATLEYYKTEPQPEPPREEQVEEKKED